MTALYEEYEEGKIPQKREWVPLRERICQEFVAPTLLLKKNYQVVSTANWYLASMAKALILRATAPILSKTLAELVPQDDYNAVLEFSFSFSVSPENGEHVKVVESLTSVFSRVCEGLKKMVVEASEPTCNANFRQLQAVLRHGVA